MVSVSKNHRHIPFPLLSGLRSGPGESHNASSHAAKSPDPRSDGRVRRAGSLRMCISLSQASADKPQVSAALDPAPMIRRRLRGCCRRTLVHLPRDEFDREYTVPAAAQRGDDVTASRARATAARTRAYIHVDTTGPAPMIRRRLHGCCRKTLGPLARDEFDREYTVPAALICILYSLQARTKRIVYYPLRQGG